MGSHYKVSSDRILVNLEGCDVCNLSKALQEKVEEMNSQGWVCTLFRYESNQNDSSMLSTAIVEFVKKSRKVPEQIIYYECACDVANLEKNMKRKIKEMNQKSYMCNFFRYQSNKKTASCKTTAIMLFTKQTEKKNFDQEIMYFEASDSSELGDKLSEAVRRKIAMNYAYTTYYHQNDEGDSGKHSTAIIIFSHEY